MPMIHSRITPENYSYVMALATMNGISASSTVNMLLTQCRVSRFSVGATLPARADARSDAAEETPNDHD
jgi:hypothetical protein